MLNKLHSRKVFDRFMNGCVINQSDYTTREPVPCPLFHEVMDNLNEYRHLYDMTGYELVVRDTFMFARRADMPAEQGDVALKLQALLLVLARGIQRLGYDFAVLVEPSAGVPEQLITQIADEDEMNDVLKACGIKNGLLNNIGSLLLPRGVMYQNAKGRYVLTEAGQAFFDEVFAQEEGAF